MDDVVKLRQAVAMTNVHLQKVFNAATDRPGKPRLEHRLDEAYTARKRAVGRLMKALAEEKGQ